MTSLPNLSPASSGAKRMMVHVVKTNGNQPAARQCFVHRRRSSEAGHGLLRLGAAELGQLLPPVFAYWRGLGSRHVTARCTRPDVEGRRAAVPPPSEEDLAVLASAAPMMPGAEYLTARCSARLGGDRSGLLAEQADPVPRSRNSSSA